MDDNFGVSGGPGDAILAPRDHPERPWEQQDGHEVGRHRILVDIGVISGPVYVSCYGSKCIKCLYIFGLLARSFFTAF